MKKWNEYWRSRGLTPPITTIETQINRYGQPEDNYVLFSFDGERALPYQRVRQGDFKRLDFSNAECEAWGIRATNLRLYCPVPWSRYTGDVYFCEGAPDALTYQEIGGGGVGLHHNWSALNGEVQAEIRRFLQTIPAGPGQVWCAPDGDQPNVWNRQQDNVFYWAQTFQKLVPGVKFLDWRKRMSPAIQRYEAGCIAFWKAQRRQMTHEEDILFWQSCGGSKVDANQVWQATGFDISRFERIMRGVSVDTPTFPKVTFLPAKRSSVPVKKSLPVPRSADRIDTQALNARVDLLALIRQPLKRAGKEYAGPCPFCGGKDRFHVQPDNHRWLCRHCTEGKWKSPIEFVMRRQQMEFLAACHYLQEYL